MRERVRIWIDPAAARPGQADVPPLAASTDENGLDAKHGHEATIVCPCCGHVAAVVTNPPNALLRPGVRVWVETDGAVVVFRRERPFARDSYREEAVLNRAAMRDGEPTPPPHGFPD